MSHSLTNQIKMTLYNSFDGFVYPEGGDDRPHEFGLFSDPIMDREEISGEDCERNKLTPYGQPNLRGEVLKPGNEDEGPEGSSNTDGLTESNGTRVQPRQFFNWSSNTGTYTSDGSKVCPLFFLIRLRSSFMCKHRTPIRPQSVAFSFHVDVLICV